MQPQSRVQKIMEGVGLKGCIMVDVHVVAFCEKISPSSPSTMRTLMALATHMANMK